MKFEFEYGGKKFFCQAEVLNAKLWIYLNGQTHVIDLATSSARVKKNKSQDQGQLQSPMPGKVTKILAQEQQSLEKGAAILVLEAMKMEYTLKASGAARLKKILCAVGDQVKMGQILAEFETDSKPRTDA